MTPIHFLVAVILLFGQAAESHWCPCSKNRQIVSNATKICVVTGTSSKVDIGSLITPSSSIVRASSMNGDLKDCVAVVSLVTQSMMERQVCPGKCRPIPEIDISEQLFSNNKSIHSMHPQTMLTCSLTVGMVQSKINQVHSQDSLEYLWLVVNRRIAECYEHGRNALPATNRNSPYYSVGSRRSVKSIVMWMGTANNIKLIQSQAKVLEDYPDQDATPDSIVIGWAATDDLYSCSDESTTCTTGTKQYNGLLPSSAMNFMPVGWRCAQRRPLRSLAHVLTLFNPQFVVLLDDDTYLNYKLMISRFGAYLDTELRSQPIYMGEFQGRSGDRGHLSTLGIFAGGSGYIIGHNLLSKLHQKAVTFFGFENRTDFGAKLSGNTEEVFSRRQSMETLQQVRDEYRSAEHRLWLSVLNEGVEHAYHACSSSSEGVAGAEKCVLSLRPLPFGDVVRGAATGRHKIKHAGGAAAGGSRGVQHAVNDSSDLVVPIAVRLIDFCSALMANDHTCQHSDHSLGRCMLYGARAIPVGVGCHSLVDYSTRDVKIGMCFMSPTCNTSEQITCHRYKAGSAYDTVPSLGVGVKVLTPERNSHKNGYYRHHSSVYDGKIVDSVG